jgi:hypothetical protein
LVQPIQGKKVSVKILPILSFKNFHLFCSGMGRMPAPWIVEIGTTNSSGQAAADPWGSVAGDCEKELKTAGDAV